MYNDFVKKLLFKTIVACALLILGVSGLARAHQVLPVDMQALVDQAEIVISGTIVSTEPLMLGRVPATKVTIDVTDSIKGELPVGRPFSFLQFGMTRSESFRNNVPYFIGAPEYRVGEEDMLFLSKTNARGLRAPIGLNQGKFQILKDGTGKATVINGSKNRHLFTGRRAAPGLLKAVKASGMSGPSVQGGGPADYGAVKGIVQDLMKGE